MDSLLVLSIANVATEPANLSPSKHDAEASSRGDEFGAALPADFLLRSIEGEHLSPQFGVVHLYLLMWVK